MANIFHIERADNKITLGTNATSIYLTPMTQGSLLFAGVSGLLLQNNSNLFWDDTNKRLGIGTTSPATKFEVSDAGITKIRVTNATDTIVGELIAGTDGAWIQTSTEHPLYFSYANSDAKITLAVGGKVGIGLVSPKTLLTVEGALTLKEQAAADGSTAAYGQIWCKTAAPNQLWFTDDAGTDLRIAPQDLQTTASPTFAGLTKVGSDTNYTEIEADGTIEFHGTATVWNDANLGVAQLALPTASQPDEDEFVDEGGSDTGISTWAFAVGEKVSGSIEIPHDYKEGSDITFHVHWQGIAAPSGTDYVKWQCTYTVAQMESTLDAVSTTTVEEAYDTQYEFKISSCTAITGTNINIGDQFLFTLERVAPTGDAYAGDALVATVGIHYECDTVGSRQMLTKA